MTGLSQAVQEAFACGSLLSRAHAYFRVREGQTRMAMAVARTISEGGALVVEAGTGVGKTFAYLVPALLSGERVLLSTATKALQDQLYSRDLPQLAKTLNIPVRIAMLKGRGSYLCLHRLEMSRQDRSARDPAVVRVLSRVEEWCSSTQTGDLAELTGLDDHSAAIGLFTSTRDNCLGSKCPRFQQCHVQLARRQALAADIVVINHHLFFADMAIRESGMAELLPTVRVVVFDEAHQINETGVQFLGVQLSIDQLLDFARDVLAAGLLHARGFADWTGLLAKVEWAAHALRLVARGPLDPSISSGVLKWTDAAPHNINPDAWSASLIQIRLACTQVHEALDTVVEIAPDFDRLYARCSDLIMRVLRFSGPPGPDTVRWVDVGSSVKLVEAPLDIAQAMRTRILACATSLDAEEWSVNSGKEHKRAWVFTSATLGDDADLTWFTERCGLQDAHILRVESPFDYAAQAAIYVPRHLPLPADPVHSAAVAQLVGEAAQRLGGRTLVLTTTLKAMRAIGDILKSRWSEAGAMDVLVQGDGPKRNLMERFRSGSVSGQAGCILVASATFWEGFDVPGDSLQLVVIDKLPFPVPGDPQVQARVEQIEKAGRRAFAAYFLPEAAVTLKQGAGRLIRRETDRGVLVIADSRLVTRNYGKRLRAALPPMPMLESHGAFEQALEALTKTSTMDLPCL